MEIKSEINSASGSEKESFYFGPFATRTLGILQSQTSLKVDTYVLACTPYQLSQDHVTLIGAFNSEEISFFQKYKGSLSGLTLVFQKHRGEAKKIFCRCQVLSIVAMKGREQVGLITCGFKPIPADLSMIIHDYFFALETLKNAWNDLRNKALAINADTSRRLGYNNYALIVRPPDRFKVAVYSIAVNHIGFLQHIQSPSIEPNERISVVLFFQRYRLTASGLVNSVEILQNRVKKITVDLEFSAELTDLIGDYLSSPGLQGRIMES